MGFVGKKDYSGEYSSSNTWKDFPILNVLVTILYILAAIAIILGIISGSKLADNAWRDAKFAAFMGPFTIGLVSAIGCVVCAELIKLFLHIQRNTYDTAQNTYVIGMVLQDIERRISIIQNQAAIEKDQNNKSVIPEYTQGQNSED